MPERRTHIPRHNKPGHNNKPSHNSQDSQPPNSHDTPSQNSIVPQNRIKAFMGHSARYSFMGVERLAVDASIAYVTLKRILSGKREPSLSTAQRIARLFSEDLAIRISTDEVFSETGQYPTESVCALVGCSGCSLQSGYLLQTKNNQNPIQKDK